MRIPSSSRSETRRRPPAPSAYPVAEQSTVFERILTSPKTILAYVYAAIALILILALISLVVFEIRKQRPINIAFAIFLIGLILILLYISESHVLVEGAQAFFPG